MLSQKGLLLHEFQDFNITAKTVAQSASRAHGLIIAKSKALGGMSYKGFTKLYDTMVWPVIYGTAVWGSKVYSCINAVQNRAMRLCLDTGKYTPHAVVSGDIGWQPPSIKQWKAVLVPCDSRGLISVFVEKIQSIFVL